MKYTNAESIFPSELLTEMQKYMQDGMIYIPKAKEKYKKWGDNTGSRQYVAERNDKIRNKFRASESIDVLAAEYHLAVETVKKIVYSK